MARLVHENEAVSPGGGQKSRVYGLVAPPWRDSLSACLDRLIAARAPALAAGGLR